MSNKYGSFEVQIKCEDGEVQTHTVSPLSQQEIANGWRLALPSRKMVTVTMKKEDGTEEVVRKPNDSYFKINLAQLPPHLYGKLRNVYRRGQLSHFQARDKCYTYIVHPTPVDEEIRKLGYYCDRHDNGFILFTPEQKEEIRSCLASVNENEIRGWVVMKSNRLFGSM